MANLAKTLAISILIFPAILLAGCMSKQEEPEATLGALITVTLQGDAKTSLLVPNNGQLSVFDVNQNKIIFTGRMKKDQHLVIDPKAHRIMIDDIIAADKLNGGDQLQVTFDQGI